MQPCKVTAHLTNPIAVYDDWSPALDSLLTWLILEQENLVISNPNRDDVAKSQAIVDSLMPVAKGDLSGSWYWQVSTPCYVYQTQQTDRFRKRWNPGADTPDPDWGKKKAKWESSEGGTKNYDLPLFLRNPKSIFWYVIGNEIKLMELLSRCSGLGKKRSTGHGQISSWEVKPIAKDWHLYKPIEGLPDVFALMRPIPVALRNPDKVIGDFAIRDWGWRPPTWLQENKSRCLMPTLTVRQDG